MNFHLSSLISDTFFFHSTLKFYKVSVMLMVTIPFTPAFGSEASHILLRSLLKNMGLYCLLCVCVCCMYGQTVYMCVRTQECTHRGQKMHTRVYTQRSGDTAVPPAPHCLPPNSLGTGSLADLESGQVS